MSESIESLRREASTLAEALAKHQAELEALPDLIAAADRKALHGPPEGVEAALQEKRDLTAKHEALELLVFRAQDAVNKNLVEQAQAAIGPLATAAADAQEAEDLAEAAFTAARDRFQAAQNARMTADHHLTTAQRTLERAQNAFQAYRNEHSKKARTNG